MTEEPFRPTKEQQRLIQAVYGRFRATGVWPTFDEVDRQLDRRRPRLDAGKIARALPGFERSPYDAAKPVRLTLEQVAVEECAARL